MAAAIWILRKEDNAPVIDGIKFAVVNADDGGTEAATIAEAVASGVAAGHKLYTGYFTSADIASAAGQLDADEDAIFVGPIVSEAIA